MFWYIFKYLIYVDLIYQCHSRNNGSFVLINPLEVESALREGGADLEYTVDGTNQATLRAMLHIL